MNEKQEPMICDNYSYYYYEKVDGEILDRHPKVGKYKSQVGGHMRTWDSLLTAPQVDHVDLIIARASPLEK